MAEREVVKVRFPNGAVGTALAETARRAGFHIIQDEPKPEAPKPRRRRKAAPAPEPTEEAGGE